MPSTYTLNNGIELIATGEQSGTWGDTTNTNFQLLDTSLDGQVTVTLASTGSSGSPNTLPVSDGAASNGRNRLVIFDDSSDLGGTAFVQLTPSDAEKIIYVRNSLSGSRSILLFQGTYSASNDYEVPAGTTAVVFFNGAGSGAVAANVFNNAHFDALNIVGNAVVGGILSLADGSNSAPSLTNTGDTNTGLYFPAADEVGITTGGTQRVKVDSTGVDITGTLVSDGLTVDGDGTFSATNPTVDIKATNGNDASLILMETTGNDFGANGANGFRSRYDGGDNALYIQSGAETTIRNRIKVDRDTGDITFYDTDGTTASFVYDASAGTTFNEAGADRDFRVEGDALTHALFVDATNSYVGVGESVPAAPLHISTTAQNTALFDSSHVSGTQFFIRNSNASVDSSAMLGFAPANDISGATITAIAEEDFSTSANRTARLEIQTRDNGNFYDRLTLSRAEAVFNDDSDVTNFRVESNNNANMLFVDAGNDLVVVGGSSGNVTAGGLNVTSNATSIPTYVINGIGVGGYGTTGNAAVAVYGATRGMLHLGGNYTAGSTDITNIKMMYAPRSTGDENAATIASIYSNNTTTDSTSGGNLTLTTRPTGGASTLDRVTFYHSEGVVFNEGSLNYDFRVESDSNDHMLFVDAGSNHVNIGTSSDFGGVLNVNGTIAMNGAGEVAGFFDLSAGITHSGDNVVAFSSGTSGSTQHSAVALWADDHSSYSGQIHLVGNTSNGGSVNSAGEVEFWTFNGSTYTLEGYMGPRGYVFNEASRNVDFRVESNNNTHMLFVDADNDRVKVSGTGGTALFNVHEAVTGTDPQFASFSNETSGQDCRAMISTIANSSGDPYLKFDAGGSNMIVGLHWEGTTNNKLMVGAADRPSDTIKGMRINGTGATAISATDFFGTLQNSNDGKLGHYFSVTGNKYMAISANATGAETMIVNNIAGVGNSAGILQYRTQNTVEGSLNGTSSGLAITNVSDYRKKENVADATGCLNKINGLRPVTYTHRSEYDSDTTTVHTGFIAHEVSDHLPSIVSGTKDAVDEDGNTVLQSLSYADHEMIANLVGAIKELKAENDAMRLRLDALESV